MDIKINTDVFIERQITYLQKESKKELCNKGKKYLYIHKQIDKQIIDRLLDRKIERQIDKWIDRQID